MSTLEVERNYVPEELVNQLVKGYDALSVEMKILDEQRRELENRLSWAKQQVWHTSSSHTHLILYDDQL